jgi:molecular chaperone HscA
MAINIEEPVKRIKDDVIGIDFGTTNSLIGIFKDGEIKIISDEKNEVLIPSVVAYDNGKTIVGIDAEKYDNAIFSIKRLLGRNLQSFKKQYPLLNINDKDNISIDLDGKNINVIKIASDIFIKLKESAENFLNKKVSKAVITVPAYFDNSSRNAVKNAAKIAGIDTLRLLSEPTAAALFYGVDKNKESGTYIVYDLGGGTFDVSVLNFYRGIFKVLSTGGDDLLGGDDFDRVLADYIIKKNKVDNLSEIDRKNIITLAKEAKENFIINDKVEFQILISKRKYKISIHINEFNELISGYIDKTIDIVKNTLKSASKSVQDVEGMLLVGGSTRIKLIVDKLTEIFGKEKIFTDLDPDTIVAKGAALYASFISGANPDKKLLLDILPLSLGIETLGGAVEKIILKDSRIPISQSQIFTNYIDGQTSFKINVVQGEREFTKDNRSLAEFTLSNIPPLPAGKARIEVTFTVNEDGILEVLAKEKTQNIVQIVEVNPSYGLTHDSIDKMIEESFNSAQADIKARQLLDAQSYAERILKIITNAIKSNGNLLKNDERKNINYHMEILKELIKSKNHDKINDASYALEKAAGDFLQRRLEFLLQGMDLKVE